MHSRVYQVSEKPITEFIDESRYYDWDHADYVAQIETNSQDYVSDLEWLRTATKGIKVDIKKKTITITSKKEYFEEQHEKFKELLEKFQDITLEEFVGIDRHFDFTDLQCAYEDKYAFYIDDNDEYGGLTNMDNWVRHAEENKEYYVGSIFDYHF